MAPLPLPETPAPASVGFPKLTDKMTPELIEGVKSGDPEAKAAAKEILMAPVKSMSEVLQKVVRHEKEEKSAEDKLEAKYRKEEESEGIPPEEGEGGEDPDKAEEDKPGENECAYGDEECERVLQRKAEARLRPKASNTEDDGWSFSSLFSGGDGGDKEEGEELDPEEVSAEERLKKRLGGYPEGDEDSDTDPKTLKDAQERIRKEFSRDEGGASRGRDWVPEEGNWFKDSANYVSNMFGMGVDGKSEDGRKGVERAAARLNRGGKRIHEVSEELPPLEGPGSKGYGEGFASLEDGAEGGEGSGKERLRKARKHKAEVDEEG